jgi:hypothetical protein
MWSALLSVIAALCPVLSHWCCLKHRLVESYFEVSREQCSIAQSSADLGQPLSQRDSVVAATLGAQLSAGHFGWHQRGQSQSLPD